MLTVLNSLGDNISEVSLKDCLSFYKQVMHHVAPELYFNLNLVKKKVFSLLLTLLF